MSPGLCSSSRNWPTIFHRATKGLGSSTTQSIEHTEALRPLFEGRTPSAQANEQAKAAQLIGHRSHSPVTVDIRSNTLACPQQQHPAAQRLQDMEGGDAGGCGAVDKAEPNVFQAQDTASRTSLLSQWQPQTLISGTTILDSGFLSNIRVIRSFKSSAMSGLGVTTVKGRSKKTQET